MPQTTLYDRTGKGIGSVELSDSLFGAPVNEAVLHQVVTAQLASRRTGTHDTRTRGEVRGGGRKPYRQKGTGRARQGSRTAPHYRGGGTVFGPHPRSYEQRVPQKMRRLALRGALTAKLGDEAIRVVDAFGLDVPRTRDFVGVLAALELTGRVLVVAPARYERLRLSARNLPTVDVVLADSLNVVDLVRADVVLIEQPALARMEEVYGDGSGRRGTTAAGGEPAGPDGRETAGPHGRGTASGGQERRRATGAGRTAKEAATGTGKEATSTAAGDPVPAAAEEVSP